MDPNSRFPIIILKERSATNVSYKKRIYSSMYNLIPLGQALKLILVNKYLIQQPKEIKKLKEEI